MRLYLAGPMTGYPDYNYPAFHRAADRLRADGHDVVSPAELDDPSHTPGDWTWDAYLRRDLAHLLDCGAVAVLPGWRASKGATLETQVAAALGMPVYDAGTLEPVDETTLGEADRLINGARQADYGHPFDDFTVSGRVLAAYLSAWLGYEVPDVPPEIVALFMAGGVKASREIHRPKRDNRVDGPGYWGCLDMVVDERARREAAG